MPVTARSYLGLLVLGLGTLVGPLDSAVNIAFPRITGDFGVPLASIRWVIVCYVLTHTSLMLVFGRLGDNFGHKRIFRAGLVLSLLTFTLCAVAWSFEWLLVFRVGQGISAALVLSCGPALATSLFPEEYRAKALGAYLMMFGVGAALGPTIGGVLVAAWGWPAVFWFRAPLALAALLLLFLLPDPPRGGERRMDTPGAALVALAMCMVLLTITQLQQAAAYPVAATIPALAGLVALGFYTRHASRHPDPLIRLDPFRGLEFTVFNLANVAINFVGFAILLLVPYFLDRATTLPVAIAGLVLAMSNAGMAAGSPLGGFAIGRIASNRLAMGGIVLVAGAALLVGRWGADPGIVFMVVPLLLVGLGLGVFQVSYMNFVTGALPPQERGVAGSLGMLTRTVGVVGSASLLSWLFSVLEADGIAAGLGPEAAFLAGFHSTFDYAAGFLIVFFCLTMIRPRIWLAREGSKK